MNKNVIIVGDPHIGAQTSLGKISAGQHLNSRIVDQLNLLDWILDVADRELVNDIILTGDIFEEPKPEPYLIAAFFNWLNRCKTNNIKVHIIMGNHDFVRIGGQYRSSIDVIVEANIDNVHVYKNMETIIIGETAYTMMPYRDRKSMSCSSNKDALDMIKSALAYQLSSIPAYFTKVVVGHLAITGSIPVGNEIDDIANELFFDPSDFNGYDFVWMGHVHKPQIMQKKSPFVAHIGSMDISNFGETIQKKHIVLFNNDIPHSFEKITLPTRDLKKITVNVPAGTEDTTQYVIDTINKSKDLNNAIVKVELILDDVNLISVNKNKVEEAMLKRGAFNISNISESKKTSLVKKEGSSKADINTDMDVESAIIQFADAHIEDENKRGFVNLAKSLFLELKGEAK